MPWTQPLTPVGDSLGLSALAAAIPLLVIFAGLAVARLKAHKAGLLALAAALLVALGLWGMPPQLALLATLQGGAFGLFPVFYIVITTLFLYNITVAGGQFEIIRASLAGVTADRRLQALLIAFCFGAFIEGAAGFGTPVAIAGATLVGLGFRPMQAAGVCLVANTAPVAFGAIGIPVVALAGVMGYDETGLRQLSTMVGRQLPFISAIIPLYVITLMVGWKKTVEVLPAVLVCGLSFALIQWASASYLGPYLPDILASLGSILALLLLLRLWQPRQIYSFPHEEPASGRQAHPYSSRQILRAWSPYLALTLMVLLWGLPAVKTTLDRATTDLTISHLHEGILKQASPSAPPLKVAARFKLNLLSAAGSAILVAAFLSAAMCGVGPRASLKLLARTLYDMRFPALTVAAVLGLAYLMNAAGMTACLGLAFTKTGPMFPFISPFLGWLGVVLTGSDTSSNVLFGGLQKSTAEQLGLSPILTGAANTSGGVMGKMISPQSLAVATAATGMVGEEGNLFRYTLVHSLLLTTAVGLMVLLQAYLFSGMIPGP